MIISELSIDDLNATELIFPIEKERERFFQLAEEKLTNYLSVKDEWEEFLVLKREPKNDMNFYDIEDLGLIIVNQKTYELLSPKLDDSIEVLTLKSDDEDFFLLNIIGTTDCLDIDNADFTALSSGQIMAYQNLSFLTEKIKCPIFRIPELPYVTMMTEEIIECYYINELSGLNITDQEYIWSEY